MKLCVRKTRKLRGRVRAPGSKSHTHRALILALLSENSSIMNPLKSKDTLATKRAIQSLGAEIKERNGNWLVKGTGGDIVPQTQAIDVGNSGTSMRFLTSVCSFSKKWVTLTGDESIRKRPMLPLIRALRSYAHIEHENGKPPIRIKNKNSDFRNVKIKGNVSSQFISSLLLTGPLTGLNLEITTELKSRPYVDITKRIIEKTGLEIEEKRSSYNIQKQPVSDFNYQVPGDYSSAANILAPCSFIDSNVTVENLDPNDPQGDRRFISILEEMGCLIERKDDAITIRNPSKLKPIDLCASDIPDVVLPLAAVCLFAEGKSRIRDVSHLRYKESDRLKAALEFQKLGGDIGIFDDSLIIKGPCDIKAGILNGFKDHRVVMALASAGMKAKGETQIDSAQMLKISYPTYVKDMRSLGAEIKLMENGS